MSHIDWSIIAAFLVFLLGLVAYSRRYMRGVADYLVASRCAGRYLLTLSEGIAGLGAITIVGAFEITYQAGFVPIWWGYFLSPLGLIIALSGFVIYRFRQTRSMTMPQFIEMRYSRRFRVFCGSLAFLSGVINYGVFPAITARFFIHFCQLPDAVLIFGTVVETFPLIMGLELGLAVLFVLVGGQITVLLTDFAQSMFSLIAFLIILIFLMWHFEWNDIIVGLQTRPSGQSMLHPFEAGGMKDFNISYYLIGVFMLVYTTRAWQGSSAYNASARTAHEARMAGILGNWRAIAQSMAVLMMPLVIYAVMHNPVFADMAGQINGKLDGFDDASLRTQMTVPIGLTYILPVGITGLFAAVMMAAAISTDNTYLHSWSSIFIQDIVLPFKKTPLTAKQHILWLRIALLGVAIFAWCFSMLFPLKDYIYMFFDITGAIFLGGAGSVIIGGLYWKRGTTGGAWAAMICGAVLSVGGLLTQSFWVEAIAPQLLTWFPESDLLAKLALEFPFNGRQMMFFAMLCSIAAYVGVSLCQGYAHNMDKLLHRGAYRRADDASVEKPLQSWRSLGMGAEFTKRDRFVYIATMVWVLGWWLAFLVGTAINLIFGASEAAWISFWKINVWIFISLGVVTTIWFIMGGFMDIRKMFEDLKISNVHDADDGRVVDGLNADDCTTADLSPNNSSK
jgi:SSS family solute:Na+ symporter